MSDGSGMIAIVGRGHSGTRVIAHTLYASGVFMGATINRSGDMVPAEELYEACRVMARQVRWQGGLHWDFSGLLQGPVAEEFTSLVESYLKDVLEHEGPRGWKLPETTLVFPWIVRLFPRARYIYWIRDPRDCIIGRHKTDDLRDFGIAYPDPDNERERRAISWKYQYDLVQATPKPEHWLTVRYEDFVLRQGESLERLEDFLGMKLGRVIVRPDPVGRWRTDRLPHMFDFFRQAMVENGYAEGLGGD